jgi:uncharacterized OB-fold protein
VDLPQPEITELNRAYWDALRAGHLMFQRCRCGHAWLPARHECPSCLRAGAGWERASGRGTLLSWVVYHTAYNPAFADRLPYHVALVQLAEGPRLITRIVDGHERLTGDARVELQVSWEGAQPLASFRLCDDNEPLR